MNVLTFAATRHGLRSVAGERRSPTLNKLENKSKLHLEGVEAGLRLALVSGRVQGSFPLHKEVRDFIVALECSLLAREAEIPTSFPCLFRKPSYAPPSSFLPNCLVSCCAAVRRER